MDDALTMIKRWVECESYSLDPESIVGLSNILVDDFSRFDPVIERFNDGNGAHHLKMTVGEGDKRYLLISHLDTVYPIGTLEKMPFKNEGNWLYGPGVLDVKSSYYIAYSCFEWLVNNNLQDQVQLVWLNTSDEEIGSPSGKHVVKSEARKADVVLVLEPALGDEGKLKTSRKGGGKFTIRVKGKSAHAGVNPEEGENAIVYLASIIQLINAQNNFEKGSSVTVGTITGGTLFNVVPEFASCEVDVRVENNEEEERISQFFLRLPKLFPTNQIEITGGIFRPPFQTNQKTSRLFRLAKNVGMELGINLEETSTGGGSDGNYAYTTGVPVLDGLGTVGGGAHSPYERVFIPSIQERALLNQKLLDNLRRGSVIK